MALYSVTSDAFVPAAANSVKTLLELSTASTDRLTLIKWWIEFNSTATAIPARIRIARASANSTSAASAPAAVPFDSSAPAGTPTIRWNASAEGTIGVILETHWVPISGGLIWEYPLGREILVPVSSHIRMECLIPTGGTVPTFAAAGFLWDE